MTERLLICEGACNGSMLKRYDYVVAKDGQSTTSIWIDVARKFVYTPHASALHERPGTYECITCGSMRRFGYD